jgi:hypothetical protein
MAKEKSAKEKQLTPQQIEVRRRQALTILKHGTLQDPDFWSQDYVDVDLFFDTFKAFEEIKKKLREIKAEKKIGELKELGIDFPSNFKIKFND